VTSAQNNADWWGSLRPQPDQQRQRQRKRVVVRSIVAAVIAAALAGGVLAATTGGHRAHAIIISDGVPALSNPNALVPGLRLGDGQDLRARLVAVPVGDTAQTLESFETARSSAASPTLPAVQNLSEFAAGHFSDPTGEEASLRTDDFQVAVEEDWETPSEMNTDVQLAEFATADDAEDALQGQQSGYGTDGDTSMSVALPFAQGDIYLQPKPDADGDRTAIVSARIGNVYIIEISHTTLSIDTAAVQRLAAAQVRALLTAGN
jgi:hypothetical protein